MRTVGYMFKNQQIDAQETQYTMAKNFYQWMFHVLQQYTIKKIEEHVRFPIYNYMHYIGQLSNHVNNIIHIINSKKRE